MQKPRKNPARPTDPRRPLRAVASDFPILSEGQRLLLKVPGSLAEIARNVGCKSKQTVLDWRMGKKTPGGVMRAKLFGAYKIPLRAWALIPTGSKLDTQQTLAIEADSAITPSTLEDCLALLAVIRRARNAVDMMPTERVRLADTEAKILTLRARLEQQAELTEDRAVREHPAWQRLKRELIKGLAAHPAAARDIVDILARLSM